LLERARGDAPRAGPTDQTHGYALSVVVPTFNEQANMATLIEKVGAVLEGAAWQIIVVDDDSPDGTAEAVKAIAATDTRVQCIRRVRRRGLAGAVIEGALASAAPFVAVIDGDLQHDETRLPEMLDALRGGRYDLAVGSRYVEGGDNAGLANRWRHVLSDGGIKLAQLFLPVRLSDPMSGFFMLPRPLFEELAATLTGQGFKILLDLALSAPAPLRVIEIPCVFHERVAGESKLDALVLAQFAGLLLDKVFGGLLPLRFISFALVGAIGVVVHLIVLTTALKVAGLSFEVAQAIATVFAMIFNFQLNNEITYRDQRLRGPRLWRGLLVFIVVCGIGAVANVGIAKALYDSHTAWSIAGAIGAVIGVVWNYAVSATLVWRAR